MTYAKVREKKVICTCKEQHARLPLFDLHVITAGYYFLASSSTTQFTFLACFGAGQKYIQIVGTQIIRVLRLDRPPFLGAVWFDG
jgi:hypothetical protein